MTKPTKLASLRVMVLFVLRKLILKMRMRMRSHPVGLDV